MSRYKSGDIVKYKHDDINTPYLILGYKKYHRMTMYLLEDINGTKHDCYYPNKLKLVKRLL
jgi:hypothetical protein